MQRLVITGGGTGGHVYPGLAVAEVARARFPSMNVHFVGGDRLEARIIPQGGWPFSRVAARPLPRRIGPGVVWSVLANARGTVQAARLLRRLRPDAVLATGGYVAGPVGLAARTLGTPLVLQEQNAVPGLTNRLLARWARSISVPHSATRGFPAGRTVVTGVPVRPAVLNGDRTRGMRAFGLSPGRPTVLVIGGSQGAQSLNRVTAEAATLLMYESWQILHQTGSEHLAWVRDEVGRREHVGPPVVRHVTVPYIEQMGDAYASADVIVCRAGASTLAEVAAWGLPAILVPYPFAAEGHQVENAAVLAAAGAAEVIPDADLGAARLADALLGLLRDHERLRRMAEASRGLARPDAADRVLDLLVAAAGRKADPQHALAGVAS